VANVPLKQRFYTTSSTAPTTARLNLRYEAISGANQDIFAGPPLRKCEWAAVMMPMPEIGAYV
jgi:hypothetical protein